MTVFKTNSFVNTDIPVNRGDKVKIKASGTVRFGWFAGSGSPKGILFDPEYNYFIDILHGQLMGRIKQPGTPDLAEWFPISEAREIIVPAPGVLEFAVNDNQPEDNVGKFRIEVTINTGSSIPTQQNTGDSSNSGSSDACIKYAIGQGYNRATAELLCN